MTCFSCSRLPRLLPGQGVCCLRERRKRILRAVTHFERLVGPLNLPRVYIHAGIFQWNSFGLCLHYPHIIPFFSLRNFWKLQTTTVVDGTSKISKAQIPASLLKEVPTVMEKRLQEAQLYKEEGNQRYREGKYRDAVSRYHRALLQLRGLDPSLPSPIPNLGPQGPALTPEQENILHTIQTDCYNNLAACLLQMEPVNYERVREYSQKVLERQPDNAKALYRAGVAFFHLQDYDQARHYLLAAVNRQPKDANVRRYLQLTQSELSSYHRKEKQLYLGMFG